MPLTPQDLSDLTTWRQDLHRHPEVSGAEAQTAARVTQALGALHPDTLVTGLGGHGVLAVFQGAAPGPSVMIRAELDALPIQERPGPAYRSRTQGVAHLCGHDGHSAILMGVARLLSRQPPASGRAILLFQPAEEDGSGAAAVLADPAFAAFRPDWAFALHNMPGLPLGQARISSGPANCASCGLRLALAGRTSHAAEPHKGLSPAPALLALIPQLLALGQGGVLAPGFRLVTLTHARLGDPSFGISPGEAELWLTLRCLHDGDMAALKAQAMQLAETAAAAHGLHLTATWQDDFAACTNAPAAVDQITVALQQTGTPQAPADGPMRASEDFGRFAATGAQSAMFLLGAGETSPALHNPDYDFPDALIAPGATIFDRILRNLLG